MCDEDQTYTERARSWLKEHEPTSEQIQDAYTRILTLVETKPHVAGGDTDDCLELLVSAYGKAGGSIDDLLSQFDAKKNAAAAALSVENCGLDVSPLYTVSDAPALVLSPDDKREAFRRLKQSLGRPKSNSNDGAPF